MNLKVFGFFLCVSALVLDLRCVQINRLKFKNHFSYSDVSHPRNKNKLQCQLLCIGSDEPAKIEFRDVLNDVIGTSAKDLLFLSVEERICRLSLATIKLPPYLLIF